MPPENPQDYLSLSGVAPIISQLRSPDSSNISLTQESGLEIQTQNQPTPNDAVSSVGTALNGYAGNGTTDEEDHIFEAHGLLIKSYLPNGDLRQASVLWNEKIAPLVAARELSLGKKIHKGAPLYNTAIAFFASGDFDTSLCYFMAADEEDVRNKAAHCFKVVIADHPLSGQALIDPIVQTLVSHWAANYSAITGCPLTRDEIKNVLAWLAQAPMDTVHAIIAVHRFQRSLTSFENWGSQHLRVRAIAEMLVALESNLKHRFGPSTQMLGGLLKKVLNGTTSIQSFTQFNAEFDRNFPHKTNPRHSPAATNWVTANAIPRINAAPGRPAKIGLVCSLAQHLRNGLAHAIEPSLDVYGQRNLAIQVAGLALCALRIAKHGADNTL